MFSSLFLITKLLKNEKLILQAVTIDAFQFANFPRQYGEVSAVNVVSNHQRHIEVFVVYDAGHKRRRSDFNAFFTKSITDIDGHIAGKPIFFNEEKALHYMRFVDASHCILRAYVPESAIEGHFDELSLKKGSILRMQIHGCYPSYAKGQEYISNPAFDESLLSLVVSDKEDLI
jgi:hypothetical protein